VHEVEANKEEFVTGAEDKEGGGVVIVRPEDARLFFRHVLVRRVACD